MVSLSRTTNFTIFAPNTLPDLVSPLEGCELRTRHRRFWRSPKSNDPCPVVAMVLRSFPIPVAIDFGPSTRFSRHQVVSASPDVHFRESTPVTFRLIGPHGLTGKAFPTFGTAATDG